MTTNNDIAKRAYELWEKAGRPDGRDADHWLQAEKELKSTTAAPVADKPKGKKSGKR